MATLPNAEQEELLQIPSNAKWSQNGTIVAGRNRKGTERNELADPNGFHVDDNQTLYIAEWENHRITEWKRGEASGQVVAGNNRPGNRNDQLNHPTDVIIDKKTNNLIICDRENRRVVKWPRQGGQTGETIISNVYCRGLAMDDEGVLYVSDTDNDVVTRWRAGEESGKVVAGGNGKGNRLDQLSWPTYIFVDREHSVYVSDTNNHRVMKWAKDATAGTVVAGGNGRGSTLTQLNGPRGVVVDHLGTVYVADSHNHRIMRWSKQANKGSIIVGENGQGNQANQLCRPEDLSFDRQNNLYVADRNNHRIQRFSTE